MEKYKEARTCMEIYWDAKGERNFTLIFSAAPLPSLSLPFSPSLSLFLSGSQPRDTTSCSRTVDVRLRFRLWIYWFFLYLSLSFSHYKLNYSQAIEKNRCKVYNNHRRRKSRCLIFLLRLSTCLWLTAVTTNFPHSQIIFLLFQILFKKKSLKILFFPFICFLSYYKFRFFFRETCGVVSSNVHYLLKVS